MAVFRNVFAVVLAGGSGIRLWPLSRLQAPKQFVSLLGEETMLEATIARLALLIEASQVLVVTNEETASGEGLPHPREGQLPSIAKTIGKLNNSIAALLRPF